MDRWKSDGGGFSNRVCCMFIKLDHDHPDLGRKDQKIAIEGEIKDHVIFE